MRDQQHLGRKEQSKAGQTPQYLCSWYLRSKVTEDHAWILIY